MLIGVLAHIRLQPLGQIAPENLEQVLKQRLPRPNKEGEHRQNGDLLLRGLKPDSRHKAVFLVHHHIDRHANQNFRGDIEQLVDNRANRGGDNLPPIAFGVAQQAH